MLIRLIGSLSFGLALGVSLAAQDLAERSRQLGDDEARRYEVTVQGAQQPAELRLLQNWTNPISLAYGAMFCWLCEDRPVAIASIYMYSDKPGQINAEFQSLSRRSVSVKRSGDVIWNPTSPGVTFQAVEAIAPADSRRQQTLQMRQIARRVSVVSRSRDDGAPRQLRRLSTPLLVYGSQDRALTGGVFAFVVGTDPDALLLVETANQGDNTIWRYGLARLCINELDAKFEDQTVWSAAEHMHPFARMNEPYSIIQAIPVDGQ